MRSSLLQSVGVGVAVAAASRTGEWVFRNTLPRAEQYLGDYVGMTVAGITAGVLFFCWRYQYRERVRLMREHDRAVQHVHHHVRNSLQVIMYRHPDDPVLMKHVERILREMTYALPGRGQHMPESQPQPPGAAAGR